MVQIIILLFVVGSLTINEAQSCYCEYFRYFGWGSYTNTRNISLEDSAEFDFEAYIIYPNDCQDIEAHWEIQRADGETELYTVLNETYPNIRDEMLPEKGFHFYGSCHFIFGCVFKLVVSPTDMRYNGAQITGILDHPECFNSSNVTESTTINIQGLLEAPTDVSIKVGVEYMTLSWNPPFTLDGVPILQYTVYIISQRHRETVNTTKTHITLEGSCTSPVYQISAWNEVGEGNTVTYVPTLYQATVEAVSDIGGICASCSFFAHSTAEGCIIELKSDKNMYTFTISRRSKEEHTLECFSVQEAGVYSVYSRQTLHGIHTYMELHSVTIRKSEGSTLSHAAVSRVDDISEPRVCASCSFTNDSTARGCTVELQNDEFTFVFNMSRQSSEELTLLECFPIPEAGVFSVSVYEVQHDGTVGNNNIMRLPDVVVSTQPDYDNTAQSAAVIGLASGLSLVCVIVAVLTAVIFCMRRRMQNKNFNTPEPFTDSSATTVQLKSSEMSATVIDENTGELEPSSATTTGKDHIYDCVELRTNNEHEPAAQCEEIQLSTNPAYGTIQR